MNQFIESPRVLTEGDLIFCFHSDAMPTKVKQPKETDAIESTAKWHEIPYPASAHTFPRQALLYQVQFDDEDVHLELTDGRRLSVPLWWIPSLYNAAPEEREKYEISRDRKIIVWDPDKCAINDEVRIDDYLASKINPD